MTRENTHVEPPFDSSDEAILALIAIEESGGGTADLQFTQYAPMLRALMEQRRRLMGVVGERH